jgi:hypothetical protein
VKHYGSFNYLPFYTPTVKFYGGWAQTHFSICLRKKTLLKMSKLWVKFKTYNAVKVSTDGRQDVDDFLKQCKKELLFLYGQFPPGELTLSTTDGGLALRPGLLLTAIPFEPG